MYLTHWSMMLFVFLAILGLGKCHSYNDTCDYPKEQWRCGDICLEWFDSCACGDVVILYNGNNINEAVDIPALYCCTLSGYKCSKTEYGAEAECPRGELLKLNGTKPCHGHCYNDYLSSKYLSYNTAHYTCPDKCIPWSDMCQGVSFCDGDEEVCGEELRCPQTTHDGTEVEKHTISTVPARSFCTDPFLENCKEKSYDLIDRHYIDSRFC